MAVDTRAPTPSVTPRRRAMRAGRRTLVTPALAAFVQWPPARRNPYPPYAALRRVDPLHESPFGVWVLSRHRDVASCLRNPAFGVDPAAVDLEWLLGRRLARLVFRSSTEVRGGPAHDLMQRLMLFQDPPDHGRLRSLVSRAFSGRAMAGVEPRIADVFEELLGPLQRRGSMDVIAEIAYPLPARVICELLGIPSEDYPLIVGHAPALARRLDPIVTEEIARASDRAAVELTDYLEGLLQSRRRQPGDDLVSALLAAEEDGSSLSHDELLATIILLLIAGHETTANLTGNGLFALLRRPGALAAFRSDATHDRAAVEELLRFDGPIQVTQRSTLEAVELGGHVIPPGRIVICVIGAANHDPTVFDRPGTLMLRREPNPHLAFSSGAHFCLGATLARAEARVMLRGLVDRLPGLELVGRPQWRPGFTIRGLQALPVRWRT
jgi:cytochrome P450